MDQRVACQEQDHGAPEFVVFEMLAQARAQNRARHVMITTLSQDLGPTQIVGDGIAVPLTHEKVRHWTCEPYGQVEITNTTPCTDVDKTSLMSLCRVVFGDRFVG
jgi:hypothetical protein|tara:strand:+ start:310 stop:624 length:315 start_codon:yes stop_codon:yes gene_type:complete